jgi:hypothetical protein
MEYINKFLLGRIKDVKGNASRPMSTDDRTVALFCTNDGEFESVTGNADIAKVYPKAKDLYRGWWRSQKNFKGGGFQVENVLSDTEVAHLLTCIKLEGNDEPVFELNSTKEALDKLGRHASLNKRNVHINKAGSEGEWEVILPLIEELIVKRGVNVFIYSESYPE